MWQVVIAMALDGADDSEVRKAFGLARRSAKGTPVELEIAELFSKVVRAGTLQSEIEEAFKFVQSSLDGILDCI